MNTSCNVTCLIPTGNGVQIGTTMKKTLKIIFKVLEVIYKTLAFWKSQKPDQNGRS